MDKRLLAQKESAKNAMLAASRQFDSASSSSGAPKKRKVDKALGSSSGAQPASKSAKGEQGQQQQQQQQQQVRMPKVLMNSRAEAAVAMAQAQTSADMYKVLEHLKKMGVEQPQTVDQLEAACSLRIKTNPDLQLAMKNNVFMTLENNLWSYKPKHNIRSKAQLLEFVKTQRYMQGVPRKELSSSYAGFDQDLQELINSQDIIALQYDKKKDKEFLFFNEPHIAIKVDKTLAEEWAKIEMPNDDRAIANELERSGQKTFKVIDALVDDAKLAEKKALVYKKRITRADRVRKVHMLDSGMDLSATSASAVPSLPTL